MLMCSLEILIIISIMTIPLSSNFINAEELPHTYEIRIAPSRIWWTGVWDTAFGIPPFRYYE